MAAQERIARVAGHLKGKPTFPTEDPIVVVCALRTPICKAKRGGFRETTPEHLLATVLRAVVGQSKIDPALLQDVVVGNVLEPGGGAAMARIAQLLAGIPHTVPLSAVNRQCSSGLQAFANVAAAIGTGLYDVGVAAGVESMSSTEMGANVPTVDWDVVNAHAEARDCLIPMGVTSENVAEKFGVDRKAQDDFAVRSHAKAAEAQAKGLFDREIVGVEVCVDGETTTVLQDDGIRPGTTAEKLGKLKAVFKEGGSTTAGNSSQVSDGAAAVLLMRQSRAQELGMPILGAIRAYSVVGVPPAIMGIGPAFAIPAAVEQAGLTLDDIDIFEINEAFASQAVYCVDQLGIDPDKVNPKGGGIALGHPLGCTGARQIATLLHELERRNQRFGVVSMCIGTGMGAAAVFERI